MPRISVIIPTRGRPEKIINCLVALANQSISQSDYEILVGIDDDDPAMAAHLSQCWLDAAGTDNLFVDHAPNVGQASVRNRLIPRAKADTLLILNDDVIPARTLLEEHLRAQDTHTTINSPVLVIGNSPWVIHEPDTLFDRMIRETSMIFFYNRMVGKPADHDWGFRHAWTLNLSLPTDAVRDAGGFTVFPSAFLEDDELAYRLCRQHNARVLYAPDASASHDHQMSPDDYLLREMKHGYSAWGFVRTAPECAHEMYHCDLSKPSKIDEFRSKTCDFEPLHDSMLNWFRGWSDKPATALSAEGGAHNRDELYHQHMPLKRHFWRRGFLEASEGQPMPTGLCRSEAPSTLG